MMDGIFIVSSRGMVDVCVDVIVAICISDDDDDDSIFFYFLSLLLAPTYNSA